MHVGIALRHLRVLRDVTQIGAIFDVGTAKIHENRVSTTENTSCKKEQLLLHEQIIRVLHERRMSDADIIDRREFFSKRDKAAR